MAYVRDEQAYRTAASAYFTELGNGLRTAPVTEYPLRDVAKAHADLEGGRTRGSIVLIP
jgi:NADPH2:quinone reductase